jgi:hypothetical protein
MTIASIVAIRVGKIGQRNGFGCFWTGQADSDSLLDVDPMDRSHDRHIVTDQLMDIRIAVRASGERGRVDPVHDDRCRGIAPAMDRRNGNAFALQQSQNIIFLPQRLRFLPRPAIATDMDAEHT